MSYELYLRKADIQSEKILALLVTRKKPFAIIELGPEEAEAVEARFGRQLPFVVKGTRLVGGYSDLVNDLRGSTPRRARPVAAC